VLGHQRIERNAQDRAFRLHIYVRHRRHPGAKRRTGSMLLETFSGTVHPARKRVQRLSLVGIRAADASVLSSGLVGFGGVFEDQVG
jgi:hypothetical protein